MTQQGASKFKIKLFLDGADYASMVEFAQKKWAQGFTTNPSLMRKAGVTRYKEFCLKVLKEIPDLPISFEVFADDLAGMRKQALEIAQWGKNVYVKIPASNTEGVATASLIQELTQKGIQLNITAVFSMRQVSEITRALKAGAPSVVSVFAGRLADAGYDPGPIMKEASALCAQAGPQVELLWASTREAFNIIEADRSGCHIITAGGDMIKKALKFGADPESMSLDAIRMFRNDSLSSGFSLE